MDWTSTSSGMLTGISVDWCSQVPRMPHSKTYNKNKLKNQSSTLITTYKAACFQQYPQHAYENASEQSNMPRNMRHRAVIINSSARVRSALYRIACKVLYLIYAIEVICCNWLFYCLISCSLDTETEISK